MKINIFTTAGGKYLDWYEKYTLLSLDHDVQKLKSEKHEIEFIQNGFSKDGVLPSNEEMKNIGAQTPLDALILKGLRLCIEKCIKEDALFFLAPPDTIFALNTLYNMVKMSEGKKGICIALPHLRMIPNNDIKVPITAQELASLIVKYKHPTFANSFDFSDCNCTWAGISTRKLNDNLYAIIHNLPTIYAARFTQADLQFWNNCDEWPHWDRGWLKEVFVFDRIKVVGSSDLGFAAELTESTVNIPSSRNGLQYNDKYFSNDIHNNGFNKFIFTMKI